MSECLKSHLCRTEFVTDGAGQRWMNSYYDNNGAQVEGLHAGRVRIMLTGQVFALMSGTAEGEQTQGIVRAVDCYLDSPLRGGVCLNTDFGEIGVIAPTLGRQFGFAYGHKENGAVFCHMAAMYAFALYRQGLPEAGCKVLRELYTQSCSFEIAQIFPGIPEYFDPAGRGMYPYLTGAASWLVYCMLTQCYGVRGQNGDLLLAPQLLPTSLTPRAPPLSPCALRGDRSPCDTAIPLRWDLASTRPRGRNWTARPCRAARMAC